MRSPTLLSLLLVAGVLAGCLADAPTDDATVETPALPLPVLEDGLVRMDVPVDVVLVGFPPATVAALAGQLEPMEVRHGVYNNARGIYPGAPQVPAIGANPVQPTAVYRVQAAGAGTAERIAAALEGSKTDGLYDAILAEDLLVAELEAQGIVFSSDRPGLVLLHLGATGHHYRTTYETGHVDRVRVFGERHPVLVLDTSAAVDPWVGDGLPFNAPLGAGEDAVTALAEATRAATHFRLLQGPLYPPTLLPCHGVTLLTAVRGTALTEALPGYRRAEDYVQPDNLTAAWEALLGEGRVHVDHKVVRLPADDPALEAVLRTGDLDALRLWMDQNWVDYWVPHEGCEPYVSVFLFGDVSDSGVSGIAMYDVRDGRRLSFSSFNDLGRLREDGAGALAPVFHAPDESRYTSDWLDFLYTHETGHLFGQRHPHDVTLLDGGMFDLTYSSIWSAMSYQQDGKLPRFGAVDEANQARNRAGFLLQAAAGDDPDDPAVALALERMAGYDWRGAAEALEPLVA